MLKYKRKTKLTPGSETPSVPAQVPAESKSVSDLHYPGPDPFATPPPEPVTFGHPDQDGFSVSQPFLCDACHEPITGVYASLGGNWVPYVPAKCYHMQCVPYLSVRMTPKHAPEYFTYPVKSQEESMNVYKVTLSNGYTLTIIAESVGKAYTKGQELVMLANYTEPQEIRSVVFVGEVDA